MYLRANAGLCSDCIPASELPVSKKVKGEALGRRTGVQRSSPHVTPYIVPHISPSCAKIPRKKNYFGLNLNSHCL